MNNSEMDRGKMYTSVERISNFYSEGCVTLPGARIRKLLGFFYSLYYNSLLSHARVRFPEGYSADPVDFKGINGRGSKN